MRLADTDLRRALPGWDTALTWREHRAAIERLRGKHAHTIRFRDAPFDGSCLTYALGLDTIDAYRRVALAFDPPVFAGRVFAHWLIERIAEQDAPAPGALAFYFDSGTWVHAGIVGDAAGPRIVSKWGEMAVFEHGLDEVPADYGDRVRCFAKPDPHNALGHFLNYARSVTSDAEIDDVLRAPLV
jgi:hypothetical protein